MEAREKIEKEKDFMKMRRESSRVMEGWEGRWEGEKGKGGRKHNKYYVRVH